MLTPGYNTEDLENHGEKFKFDQAIMVHSRFLIKKTALLCFNSRNTQKRKEKAQPPLTEAGYSRLSLYGLILSSQEAPGGSGSPHREAKVPQPDLSGSTPVPPHPPQSLVTGAGRAGVGKTEGRRMG